VTYNSYGIYTIYQSCGCINLQQNKPKNAINGMNLICPLNPSPPLLPKFSCLPKGKKKERDPSA